MSESPTEPSQPPGPRAVAWFAWLSLLVVAIPVALTPVPPLLDYPNHYARIWLIAEGIEAGGPVAQMYAHDWSQAWTNIGIDLAAAFLGIALPASVIGPILVAAAVVLPPLGAIVLHRQVFGPARWWQAGLAVATWTTTLVAGFLNYQIGLGLALLAAAGDEFVARRGPLSAFALRAAIAIGLIAEHSFSLFFYAALLCGLSLGPSLKPLLSLQGWREFLTKVAVRIAPLIAVLAAFWLLAPNRPAGTTFFVPLNWELWKYLFFCAFSAYDGIVDKLWFAGFVLLALAAALTGRLKLHAGLMIAGLAIAVLAMVAPLALAGAFWINKRLPFMALLALLVAIDPRLDRRPASALMLASVCLLLVIGRTVGVGHVWRLRQGDFEELRRAAEVIPPGASVLTMEHDPPYSLREVAPAGRFFHGGVVTWNDSVLVIPWRQAFAPTLFAMAGQQPVRVKPPWTQIAVPTSTPANIHALWGERGIPGQPSAPYVRCWRSHFDYALVINADMPDVFGPWSPPPEFTLLRDTGYAKTYKIRREGPPGAPRGPCKVPPLVPEAPDRD